MTTLIIKVDDESTESLKKILNDMPYVRDVVVEKGEDLLNEPSVQYQKIRDILEDAKGKNLFNEITDPVEWQRELRKEWDRDF